MASNVHSHQHLMGPAVVAGAHAVHRQWRRHGVDWGEHVHPTFARGRS